MATGSGTKDDPWQLKTPPGTSDYTMHRENRDGVDVIVCTVGSTWLTYDARCLDDLPAMLRERGDWVELGAADEQKPAKDGTVEAWGRSADNPVGGWYGLRKGYRGRFGMYVPPLLEALGLVELEHNPRNNRVRAL
jgi:hypothetical protein